MRIEVPGLETDELESVECAKDLVMRALVAEGEDPELAAALSTRSACMGRIIFGVLKKGNLLSPDFSAESFMEAQGDLRDEMGLEKTIRELEEAA